MGQPQRVLWLVIGIVIVMAFVDTLLPWATTHTGEANFIGSAVLALCAFAWVRADAQARDIKPPRGSALLAALIIPIGVPVYLFRALGIRRGAWGSLKALGFMICVVLVYVGVAYVAEGFR